MYPEKSARQRHLLATRVLFVLAFVMAAATTFFAGAPTAWAADVTCTGVMSGGASGPLNINGNVNVPDHASCTLSFVNVRGNVQAGHGSTLVITAYIEPSTIGGNVQANQCYSALLEGDVTVSGNVQIQQCDGNGPNGFQGPGIVINGNFECQENSSNAASCLAWLGKVYGNVQIQANHGPTAPDVSLVTIGGNVICQQNSPAPTHVHGPSWVDGNSLDQCAGFSTTSTSISTGTVTPAASCAALASLPASGFPVPNTVITSAVDTPAGSGLPERCIVKGYVNQHLSPVDNCMYQDGFQVQLPLSAAWNGRLFMEGGSGGEGTVPTATGANTGSASSNFGITNGYAVASQDGGHENSQLAVPTCGAAAPNLYTQTPTQGFGNTDEFWLDPMGVVDNSYQSVEVSALTAKYLISQYYGSGPGHSYWVGCSTGGRQGMFLSQDFPQYFDGIAAGAPVYDSEAGELSAIWGYEQILNVYLTASPPLTPPTPADAKEPAPVASLPLLYPAFPSSDQSLFETALLQACDALDGVTDGVIDNSPECRAKFDPTTATYIDYAGALGPPNTTYPLQCPGAKNATCLSPAQIQAVKNIVRGAQGTRGAFRAPAGAAGEDPVSNVVWGYPYDGGYFSTVGIPARYFASPTSAGNANTSVEQFPYAFISPANPTYNTLSFNFNTYQGLLTTSSPDVTTSISLNITPFVKYGHKIFWYHGLSDPEVSVNQTLAYYQEMANRYGGLQAAQNFSRYYPIPNMNHCNGGAATDQFDLLTPLVNWVENHTTPGPIPATGVNFNAATYRVLGNYITSGFVNAPTTRSRPICPYPQEARFTGSVSVVSGVPVATNPADLANASNYTCVQPQTDDLGHDH